MYSVIVDLIGIALIIRWFKKEDRKRNEEIKGGSGNRQRKKKWIRCILKHTLWNENNIAIGRKQDQNAVAL